MRAGSAAWGLALAAALGAATPAAPAGTSVPLPPAASPPVPPPAAAGGEAALPPYQDDLERLAELMGTLALMREICGTSAGPDWRAKMADLLATEGVTDERRARLAGRFNRGYEGYRLTYRSCTRAAETIIGRSLAEGSRLSNALSSRLGGD